MSINDRFNHREKKTTTTTTNLKKAMFLGTQILFITQYNILYENENIKKKRRK